MKYKRIKSKGLLRKRGIKLYIGKWHLQSSGINWPR